jgi:hypothetical protein
MIVDDFYEDALRLALPEFVALHGDLFFIDARGDTKPATAGPNQLNVTLSASLEAPRADVVRTGLAAARVYGRRCPSRAWIGRTTENEIAINQESISRQHATIEVHSDTVVLTDAGSHNGTFIEGERLAPGKAHTLQAGQRIRFGDVLILFMRAQQLITLCKYLGRSRSVDRVM